MTKGSAKTLIVFSVIFLSLFSFFTFAKSDNANQGQSGVAKENKTEVLLQRQEAQEQRRLQRCEQIAERARNRIGKMEDNKGVHQRNYGKIVSRLTEIIVKMSDLGLDTADLGADVSTFSSMVTAYMGTYSDFINSLGDYEGGVCNETGNGHKVALQGAKDHLKNLIQKRKEIRTFYSSQIRLEIKALRDQVQDLKAEEVTNE